MTINIVPFFSIVSPEGLEEEVLNEIKQEGVRVVKNLEEIPSGESVFLFIGTGGTENDVSTFLNGTKLKSVGTGNDKSLGVLRFRIR